MAATPARPRWILLVLGVPLVLTGFLSGGLIEAQQPEAYGHVSATVGAADPLADGRSLLGAREGDGTNWTHLTWRHADRTWRLNVSIDPALLQHHEAKDRLPFDHDYAAFVLDDSDDAWVAGLAEELDRMYSTAGLKGVQKVEGFLAFVQHLPYALDKNTTPYSEWPRYPAETLTSAATDCEDTAVLLVSLLRALGYDTVLISPPRHMAAGIALPEDIDGTFVEHDGKRYYYAETTGENWKLGRLPARFDGDPLRVIPLDPQALVSRPSWSITRVGEGLLEVTLAAHNLGDLPARDLELSVALEGRHGKTWQRGTCPTADAAPFTTVTCTIVLTAPPPGDVQRVRGWAQSPDAPHRTDTGPLVIG